jgi:pimeloyl-ACP methyl ester carboxylesterase
VATFGLHLAVLSFCAVTVPANGPGPRRIKDDDVGDLAGLIAHVADGPADVVGNSLGASIALRLAALHPELVHSLSAHEPPLYSLLDEPSPAAQADCDAQNASVAS